MNSPATKRPPARRTDLVIKPIGDDGRHVVKDPQSAEFFQIGPEEHFLLMQLDGQRDAKAVCAAFEEQFGEPLAQDDLDGFLEMASKQGLLEIADSQEKSDPDAPSVRVTRSPTKSKKRQSILYWRKRLFDPDRFCNWVEPKIRFFWTRGFLIVSAACLVFACGLLWLNRGEVVTSFRSALKWETLVVAWVVMLVVVTLHEFAHGLTCKHFGGEVHEIGFLLMFFMPCFYCNVSDAWLFKEKSKRLWVTFNGGYFELFLWALAVFVWRLTALDSVLNYLAFIVIASAGVQSLFNFNPLLKLDGYYLLSDWVEVPNLRQRALGRAKAHFRHVVWGGPKPAADQRGRFLTGFGIICWSFSTLFLVAMLFGLARWFGSYLGSLGGYLAAGGLAVPALLGVMQGTSSGEFKKMITKRRVRTFCWLLILGGVVAGLCFVEVDEYFSGDFTLRPALRKEIRGPVAGFLKEVRVDEGDRVSPGDLIAVLGIPDLDSRIAQKRAELSEAESQLKLLEEGTRPEKIADQQARIDRAVRWHAAAKADLQRLETTLQAELHALAAKVAAAEASRDAAKAELSRVQQAAEQQAATQTQVDEAQAKWNVAQARVKQAQAEFDARKAQGNLAAEQELARRAKDLADERAALKLLDAGTRPYETAAGRARVIRVNAELRQLRELQGRLEIRAEAAGVVVTPRLREKVGSYVREGDAICVVEDRSAFEADVALTEEKIARIKPGQRVELKVRALPFETVTGRVIAAAQSAAAQDRSQSAVAVYCRIEPPAGSESAGITTVLRSAQTGHARIYTDRKPVGGILLDRALRLLRTEFWW
jgi:putative peptide zinc metalloprotease protein